MHFEAVKKASTLSVNNIISNIIELEYQGETLLLDDESILDQINADEEADAENEMSEYHTNLEKFQKDFEDVIKLCEGYESFSMFHYLLKTYLKEIVQVPQRMEEEDAKQAKINKLRIT